ncbi:hypothetical protein [Amycolatopsis sp. NPDC051071]|uniref:hypothetical protein n=1 Tax=Amycolatopsis sp. NPDC051071 TaxID=3154637 RepID=UPI003445BB70
MGTSVTEAAGLSRVTEADYAQRYYTDDGLVHDYLKRELADPGFVHLTPWCQRGNLLPAQHLRRKVDRHPVARHSKHQLCPPCVHERHEMRQGRPS